MRISLIVAAAANGVIGRGNDLPWQLPADLGRFKRLTMGHHLVIGRRTWDSIGRPLPGRRMIVISRAAPHLPPGVQGAASLDEALGIARRAGESEAFVAGGAAIYALALPVADRLYLTRIEREVDGDVLLPPIDFGAWRLVAREPGTLDARNALPHAFETWERDRDSPAQKPAVSSSRRARSPRS